MSPPGRAERYKRLAEAYGWDPNQTAGLTPVQQVAMLPGEDKTVTFATEAEYARWITQR